MGFNCLETYNDDGTSSDVTKCGVTQYDVTKYDVTNYDVMMASTSLFVKGPRLANISRIKQN